MTGKYAKLVMVTADNNNKFYEMTEKGGQIDVRYGRIKSTEQTATYPMSMWDTKYNEKVKKGYKDVTHTVVTTTEVRDPKESKLAEIEEAKVQQFLTLMKKYTDGLVSKTYTVKAQDVTQQQVDNAQKFIDRLMKTQRTDVQGINNLLLELYMEIPRKMDNVRNYLLPNINLDQVLQQEQDNLDAMAAQVAQLNKAPKKKKTGKSKEVVTQNTLLDVLGVTMKEAKPPKEVEYLIKQLTGRKIDGFFEIRKQVHDDIFDKWMATQKNKQTRILIHGTRCSSVIPIIEQGLKIRPAGNYQFSGKVYGDGNYFSETCSKSLNYTGNDRDKILLVYEVHVGNAFTYDGWYRGNSFPLDYKNLQERGYDSTFVKAGGGLLNTEIICYKEQQCRIKYIIHLKN